MEFLARLVHADASTRIVEVQALLAGRLLGSALGEAGSAEAAETRALERLMQRLEAAPPSAAAAGPTPAEPLAQAPRLPDTEAGRPEAAPSPDLPLRPQRPGAAPAPATVAPATVGPAASGSGRGAGSGHPLPPQLRPGGRAEGPGALQAGGEATAVGPAPPRESPATAADGADRPATADAAAGPEEEAPPAAAEEPPPDPEDWSEELARLDLGLRRLGWSREAEAAYLMRAFGHPSRSRLTSYADLVAYLRQVEALEPGADPATTPVPLRRRDLLSQGDGLLQQLGWDTERARRFIREQMGVAGRSQLNEEQLLRFNMQLEMELLAGGGMAGPGRGGVRGP